MSQSKFLVAIKKQTLATFSIKEFLRRTSALSELIGVLKIKLRKWIQTLGFL